MSSHVLPGPPVAKSATVTHCCVPPPAPLGSGRSHGDVVRPAEETANLQPVGCEAAILRMSTPTNERTNERSYQ